MKNSIRTVLLCSSLLFSTGTTFSQDTSKQKLEALYNQWQTEVDKHPTFSEPMWFMTERQDGLANAYKGIISNKIAMAYFLCERFSEQTNLGATMYPDILLLEKVSGIDLSHADDKPIVAQDFGDNMNRFMAQFREDWRAGVYKDPSKRISKLCEERLSKEGDSRINSMDLISIRRYGIFGLPELTRQIQKHNSKHAFAAYLIITGQPDEYDDYLEHSDTQFTNSAEKISHIKKKVEEMKSHTGGDFDVMKKISDALVQEK